MNADAVRRAAQRLLARSDLDYGQARDTLQSWLAEHGAEPELSLFLRDQLDQLEAQAMNGLATGVPDHPGYAGRAMPESKT